MAAKWCAAAAPHSRVARGRRWLSIAETARAAAWGGLLDQYRDARHRSETDDPAGRESPGGHRWALGRGVACGFWFNIGGESSAQVHVNEDGFGQPGYRRLACLDGDDGSGNSRHSGRARETNRR